MIIRSMKLREAHKNTSASSYCSILYDLKAQHIVTSSSSDSSICIHVALVTSGAPKILRNHRDGVTCLALSPDSTCLASGSMDHSVKLYKFPVWYINFWAGSSKSSQAAQTKYQPKLDEGTKVTASSQNQGSHPTLPLKKD